MKTAKAKRVLRDNGIVWSNYADICSVLNARGDNWAGCEEIKEALEKVKRFILTGEK